MTGQELRRIQKSDRKRLKSHKEYVERSLKIAREVNSKNKNSEVTLVKKAKNLPATQGQLDAVRSELLNRISELEKNTNARFKEVDARFDKLEASILRLEAKMSKMMAMAERQRAMYEELSSHNRAVFDGWNDLNRRMERMELNWIRKFGPEA
jgi:methyl-accepting chemotaxis protein